MIEVVRGVNKICSEGLFHNSLCNQNIFWNGTNVYLGLPLFSSIIRTQRGNRILNQVQIKKQVNAIHKKDIFFVGKYLEGFIQQAGFLSLQKMIHKNEIQHIQNLVQTIKFSEIEVLQIFKQLKALRFNLTNKLIIKFSFFESQNKRLPNQHIKWEKKYRRRIENHFDLCILFTNQTIRIEVSTTKLKYHPFCQQITTINYPHSEILSFSELYERLTDKTCQILISNTAQLVFALNKRMNSFERNKIERASIETQMMKSQLQLSDSLYKMEYFINFLTTTLEELPQTKMDTTDLKANIMNELHNLLQNWPCSNIGKQFRAHTLSRLKTLKQYGE